MKKRMMVMSLVLVLAVGVGGGWLLALHSMASRHKAAQAGRPGVTENALNKWGLTSANSFGVVARKR